MLTNFQNNSLLKVYNFLLLATVVSLSLPNILFSIFLVPTLILALMIRINYKISPFKHKEAWLFFSIYAYFIIRTIDSSNLSLDLKFLEKNLSYILLPIVIIPEAINDNNKVFKSFVFSYFIVALYTVFAVFLTTVIADKTSPKWYFQNIETVSFHPTYMALYAVFALLFLDKIKESLSKKWFYFLTLFFLVFILFTASRIALVALFVLFIYRAILFRKKRDIVTLVSIILLFGITYTFSNDFRYKINQISTFKGLSYDNNDYGSVSVRVAKTKAAFYTWKKNIWFGVGIDDLKNELIKQYRSKKIECWPCAQRRYNPHNQYLSYLSGHGIVGLLLFFTTLLFFGIQGVKNKNQLLVESLIIVLIFMLTESLFERQKGITIVLFFLLFLNTIHIKNNAE